MATSAGTAVAAMAARAHREIEEQFDRNNAFDPGHAVSCYPPSQMHRRQFDYLVGRGLVREGSEGSCWLDRDAEQIEQERRRAAVIVILKIVLIAIALFIAAIVTAPK